jgi:hypothetical protein
MENVIAAFEHSNRIDMISSDKLLSSPSLLSMMLKPFPALKYLALESFGRIVPDIPDSFLGGSAPQLQHLHLTNMSFPALSKLLSSVTNLISLTLRNLPHSGYISPEVMATCLSAWTRLERLELRFQYPGSHLSHTNISDREIQNFPSSTCATLPALTRLEFEGESKYLEELVARVDAMPILNSLNIQFFGQPIFHTPCLSRFISQVPKFQALTEASVVIFGPNIFVTVPTCDQSAFGHRVLTIGIPREDWQPSSLTQLCTESLSLFLTVEHLYMTCPQLCGRDIENTQWLELLHLFAAVKNLYLTGNFAQRIASVLQDLVGKRVTEVLPALQNIFLQELRSWNPAPQGIIQFFNARWHSSSPIAVSDWQGGSTVNDYNGY